MKTGDCMGHGRLAWLSLALALGACGGGGSSNSGGASGGGAPLPLTTANYTTATQESVASALYLSNSSSLLVGAQVAGERMLFDMLLATVDRLPHWLATQHKLVTGVTQTDSEDCDGGGRLDFTAEDLNGNDDADVGDSARVVAVNCVIGGVTANGAVSALFTAVSGSFGTPPYSGTLTLTFENFSAASAAGEAVGSGSFDLTATATGVANSSVAISAATFTVLSTYGGTSSTRTLSAFSLRVDTSPSGSGIIDFHNCRRHACQHRAGGDVGHHFDRQPACQGRWGCLPEQRTDSCHRRGQQQGAADGAKRQHGADRTGRRRGRQLRAIEDRAVERHRLSSSARFARAAMLAAGVVGAVPGCAQAQCVQPEVGFSVAALRSHWREQDERGRRLVEERGTLRQLGMGAALSCGPWVLGLQLAQARGRRGYDGVDSGGAPIVSTSALVQSELKLEALRPVAGPWLPAAGCWRSGSTATSRARVLRWGTRSVSAGGRLRSVRAPLLSLPRAANSRSTPGSAAAPAAGSRSDCPMPTR
jgi:hypothetical protein